MIDPAAPGSLPLTAQTTPSRMKYIGKVGSAVRAAIERLYAAHNEKVQMRLAPMKRDHPEHFTATDLPPRSISPASRPHVQ